MRCWLSNSLALLWRTVAFTETVVCWSIRTKNFEKEEWLAVLVVPLGIPTTLFCNMSSASCSRVVFTCAASYTSRENFASIITDRSVEWLSDSMQRDCKRDFAESVIAYIVSYIISICTPAQCEGLWRVSLFVRVRFRQYRQPLCIVRTNRSLSCIHISGGIRPPPSEWSVLFSEANAWARTFSPCLYSAFGRHLNTEVSLVHTAFVYQV